MNLTMALSCSFHYCKFVIRMLVCKGMHWKSYKKLRFQDAKCIHAVNRKRNRFSFKKSITFLLTRQKKFTESKLRPRSASTWGFFSGSRIPHRFAFTLYQKNTFALPFNSLAKIYKRPHPLMIHKRLRQASEWVSSCRRQKISQMAAS